MNFIRATYKKTIRGLSIFLLVLLGLHLLSIHGVVDSLVYCFEGNGQINIESEAGAIFSIPAEDALHAEISHDHSEPTIDSIQDSHHDVALSQICSKEQQITRYDQDRALKLLNGLASISIEQLPKSFVFQFNSIIPPLIEDVITTSLQTVILLN